MHFSQQPCERVIVNGGSMRPFLRHGQRVVVVKTAVAKLRVGEPVVFRHPGHGGVLLHRIRRIRHVDGRVLLLLRGDNTGRYDGWLDWQSVVGVAVKVLAGGQERAILPVENRLALVVAPLLFRIRKLAISVLAFCVCFLYSYIRLEKTCSVDSAGVKCCEYSWYGWAVCRHRSNGRAWVHPVFAPTGILKEIMQELK